MVTQTEPGAMCGGSTCYFCLFLKKNSAGFDKHWERKKDLFAQKLGETKSQWSPQFGDRKLVGTSVSGFRLRKKLHIETKLTIVMSRIYRRVSHHTMMLHLGATLINISSWKSKRNGIEMSSFSKLLFNFSLDSGYYFRHFGARLSYSFIFQTNCITWRNYRVIGYGENWKYSIALI